MSKDQGPSILLYPTMPSQGADTLVCPFKYSGVPHCASHASAMSVYLATIASAIIYAMRPPCRKIRKGLQSKHRAMKTRCWRTELQVRHPRETGIRRCINVVRAETMNQSTPEAKDPGLMVTDLLFLPGWKSNNPVCSASPSQQVKIWTARLRLPSKWQSGLLGFAFTASAHR